jgi:tRNA G46 methylase TrmB
MMQFDAMVKSFRLSDSPHVIVELGSGDGHILEKLAKSDNNNNHHDHNTPPCTYIGIELDRQQYEDSKRRINLDNVKLLNGSFEDIIPIFPDSCLDLVIAVLPHPNFIDRTKQHKWEPFYKTLYSKLKNNGSFQLVTEITDELFQPVSDEIYAKWVKWLSTTFQSMGFLLVTKHAGAPLEYSSRYINQFRGDPERIRMVTLHFEKGEKYTK